jgi:hypothetical protein
MTRRPTIDATPAGMQRVIPGAERITDRELAERRMAGRKRASVPQVPPGGMFAPPEPEQPPLPLAPRR